MRTAVFRGLAGWPSAVAVAAMLCVGCGGGDEEQDKSGGDAVMRMFTGQAGDEPTGRVRELRQQPSGAKAGGGASSAPASPPSGVTGPSASAAGSTAGAVSPPPAQGQTPPSSSAHAAGTRVTLTRAVMLPQTLPDGTQATFSVDYEFSGDGPRSGYKYALVISTKDGLEGMATVEVESSGTLQLLSSGFRPTDGPFRGWLVEQPPGGEPRPLCEPVTFKE